MDSLRLNNRRAIRLDPGDEVVQALREQLDADASGFAFISAAGGVSRVKLGYWDAETKKYEHREFNEQLEVLVLQGNASLKDGEPYLHLHAVFGRSDFSTLGGHVVAADVYPTMELWVRAEDTDVYREKDPATGLDVLAFEHVPA